MKNHGIKRKGLQVYPARNRSWHNASTLTARVLETVTKVLFCDQGCLSDHSSLSGLSTLLYWSSHGRRYNGLFRSSTTVIILTQYVDKLVVAVLCWSYLHCMWTWSLHWFLFHVCDLSWTAGNVWGPGSAMLHVYICVDECLNESVKTAVIICVSYFTGLSNREESLWPIHPSLLVLTWKKIQWTSQVFNYCDHTHSTCEPGLYIDSCSVCVAYLNYW